MIKYSVITLFPDIIETYVNESLIKRAQDKKLLKVEAISPRDFTDDKHKTVDDKAYGGGPGMVMKAEPIVRAVQKAIGKKKGSKVVILSPRGKEFTNKLARNWAKKYKHLVLISGKYEGIDARAKKVLKAEEVSIGPYVLTGGELPALVVIDSLSRQIKGVLGKSDSLEESRAASKEVYTRPEKFTYKGRTYRVPMLLISGNHAQIENWRIKKDISTKSRKKLDK